MYRVLGAVIPLLPPRLGYWLFGFIGALFFYLFADAREPLRANLRHVMRGASQAEIDRTARQTLRNHLKNYFDFFRATRLSAEQIKGMVEVQGLEHLQEALQKGKGVIFVSAHFGNIDIVGQTFIVYGYKVTIPAEHIKPEILFQNIVAVRGAKGIKIIPVDGPMLPLVRGLKRNEVIGLAGDLDATKTGGLYEFFGAPAQLPTGHVQIALKTGAPILPAFCVRKPDNSFVAYAEPAIHLLPTGDEQADVRAGMEQFIKVMEKWIGQHPEQWVFFHRIWDTGSPIVQ